MTLDVNTIEISLPTTISAYVVSNPDSSFTIVLNSRMTFERRMQSYRHELQHLQNGDYERNSADLVEFHAHGLSRSE